MEISIKIKTKTQQKIQRDIKKSRILHDGRKIKDSPDHHLDVRLIQLLRFWLTHVKGPTIYH